jgi:rSAM/selenodomain-associated transferase 2
MSTKQPGMAPGLAVVIPTLEAAATLAATLAALGPGAHLVHEIVVADGGSGDATVALAGQGGARVVTARPGRGRQLAAGARATNAEWLLFLHADTRLGAGWAEETAAFMASAGEAAAAFRFALDDSGPAARRLEAMVAWRCRVLGLPDGDQGLLLSREYYQRLGGFRPWPLMEDVDLVRRIGRARLRLLESPALTSAARYRGGYLRRSSRNLSCLGLYYLGLPPAWLVRLYG